MKWRVLLVAIPLALAAASPAASQPAPAWASTFIIVPGVSVGKVALGMTKAMVFNRLGMPSNMQRQPSSACSDGCEDLFWIYTHKNARLVASWTITPEQPEEQAGVDFIYTNAPVANVGGLQIGVATVKHAVDRYGWWNNRSGPWVSWTSAGMRMRFDGHDTLEAVVIVPRE
jgi:hypothetical protein